MKSETITKLKAERDQSRKKVFYLQNDTDIHNYRRKGSLLKTSIKFEKAKFYNTALCSRKPKSIWKTIHRILKPKSKAITATLRQFKHFFFSNIAYNLTGKSPESNKRQTYWIRLT